MFENPQDDRFHLKRKMAESNGLPFSGRKRRHILIPNEQGYVEVNPDGKYDLTQLHAIRTMGGGNECIARKKPGKDPNTPNSLKVDFFLCGIPPAVIIYETKVPII